MAVNTYNYSVIGTTNYRETHSIGEVWTTVLWDLNWQFIYRNGFNADFLGSTGGNNQFLRLVLQGCKLQTCNPGFLDGRDAILRADSLLNGASNSGLIWTMFARRGMGFSANQGIRLVAAGTPNGLPGTAGIVAAYDMPPGSSPVVILNPATTPLSSQSANVIKGSLVAALPQPGPGCAHHSVAAQQQRRCAGEPREPGGPGGEHHHRYRRPSAARPGAEYQRPWPPGPLPGAPETPAKAPTPPRCR